MILNEIPSDTEAARRIAFCMARAAAGLSMSSRSSAVELLEAAMVNMQAVLPEDYEAIYRFHLLTTPETIEVT